MNPFNLFLVLAVLGAMVAIGAVVVSECRDAELVSLPATVVDKAIVVKERTVTSAQPAGCSTCPGGGSGTTTVATVVQEETFFLTLEVQDNGKISTQRIEVVEALFRKVRAGDAVEFRMLRGKTSGRQCSRPEIVVPEPAR